MSKVVNSIREAVQLAGLRDGMTVSFHHHLRNGDFVLNMVMEEIAAQGNKDINVNASSLFTSAYTRGQDFYGRLDFPLWFDDHMNGYFSFLYDVDGAIWENIALGITKRFHCWNISAEVGRECERSGSDYDKEYSNYFAIYLSLAAMPGTAIGHKIEP